jgi:DNA polymerase-3 subunit delta'
VSVTTGSFWDGLTGQAEAIETLRAAASTQPGNSSMTHSWLITGPPGSGRSNLAYAFAAALLSRGDDDADATIRQVGARSHPDLAVLSTERIIITIDEVRSLVAASQFSPSVGRYRVVVIEDADRMTERTSNLLLKALEEPPPRTVWILCAPSEADLIPTIRSRVRGVRLRVPSVADVAALIERRDGVDHDTALVAAREAQSHIGMAHRLATNPEARDRRRRTCGGPATTRRRSRRSGTPTSVPARSVRSGSSRGAPFRRPSAVSCARSMTIRSVGPPAVSETASTASWSTCSRSTATSCCCISG